MTERLFSAGGSGPVKFHHTDPKMHYVRYRCMNQKCGATDVGKFFENEPIPLVINCWQCGSGRGLSVQDMMQQRKGMGQVMEQEISGAKH